MIWRPEHLCIQVHQIGLIWTYVVFETKKFSVGFSTNAVQSYIGTYCWHATSAASRSKLATYAGKSRVSFHGNYEAVVLWIYWWGILWDEMTEG